MSCCRFSVNFIFSRLYGVYIVQCTCRSNTVSVAYVCASAAGNKVCKLSIHLHIHSHSKRSHKLKYDPRTNSNLFTVSSQSPLSVACLHNTHTNTQMQVTVQCSCIVCNGSIIDRYRVACSNATYVRQINNS